MNAILKQLQRLLIVVFIFVPLSGCSLFSPVKSETMSLYLLDTPPVIVPHAKKNAGTILVMLPDTKPIYNTTSMAYRICPHTIAYFVKSRWAETPAQMIQALLVQTLLNTKHFRAVITPPLVARYEYTLLSEIIALRQDFTKKPPFAKFKLRVYLVKTATSKIIATKDFVIKEPFYTITPTCGVIAENKAVKKILAGVARFVVKHT